MANQYQPAKGYNHIWEGVERTAISSFSNLTQERLRLLTSLGTCLPQPNESFLVIGLHTKSFIHKVPQVELCINIILISSQTIPTDGFYIVLRDTPTRAIARA